MKRKTGSEKINPSIMSKVILLESRPENSKTIPLRVLVGEDLGPFVV